MAQDNARTVDAAGSSGRPAHDAGGDLDTPKAGSNLDAVLAQFADEVRLELLRVPVPLRPGTTLICDPNKAADGDVYNAWVKKSRDKRWRMSRDDVGVDTVKLAGIILANTCVTIEATDPVTKRTVELPDTFASESLIDTVGAIGPADAARKLFGADGHLMKAARAVSEAAGMDDADLEDGSEDPTQRR